jgi:hypothetical protein
MIQCARLAFGYGGIFDQDEAERIAEVKTIDPATGEIVTAPSFDVDAAIAAVKECPDEAALLTAWQEQGALAISAKDKTGHAALKEAVKNKRAAFAAAPVDVEARETAEVPQ